MKMIDAKKFEQDAASILAELDSTQTVTILRDGKPFAELRMVPTAPLSPIAERPSLFGALAHPAYRYDDPFGPACDPEDWDAVRGEWEPRD